MNRSFKYIEKNLKKRNGFLQKNILDSKILIKINYLKKLIKIIKK